MKVSVLLITYNQEEYIAQTIETILMQETNFDYEIVIGEDCSTDKTRNILRDYQKNYPDKIRLIFAERNRGLVANFTTTYKACSGQYIAMIDGDDYWTSPRKLQMQADFLDSNKEFAICFHPVAMDYEDDATANRIWPENIGTSFTLEDILSANIIPSCTVMFRNGLVREFPDWYYSLKIEDWSLYVLLSQHGKIGCLNETMAVHRVHSKGVWSSQEGVEKVKEDIKFYSCMKTHFGRQYRSLINTRLEEYYYKLAEIYEDDKDYGSAKQYIIKSLAMNPFIFNKNSPKKMKVAIRLYLPSLYKRIKAHYIQ